MLQQPQDANPGVILYIFNKLLGEDDAAIQKPALESASLGDTSPIQPCPQHMCTWRESPSLGLNSTPGAGHFFSFLPNSPFLHVPSWGVKDYVLHTISFACVPPSWSGNSSSTFTSNPVLRSPGRAHCLSLTAPGQGCLGHCHIGWTMSHRLLEHLSLLLTWKFHSLMPIRAPGVLRKHQESK